jgi:hypothetical protein
MVRFCAFARANPAVFDTRYAITDPGEHFASGRAEETIFFHKTVAQSATVL